MKPEHISIQIETVEGTISPYLRSLKSRSRQSKQAYRWVGALLIASIVVFLVIHDALINLIQRFGLLRGNTLHFIRVINAALLVKSIIIVTIHGALWTRTRASAVLRSVVVTSHRRGGHRARTLSNRWSVGIRRRHCTIPPAINVIRRTTRFVPTVLRTALTTAIIAALILVFITAASVTISRRMARGMMSFTAMLSPVRNRRRSLALIHQIR